MNKKPAALAEYINVDLEVRSRVDLRPLAEALSADLFSLYVFHLPLAVGARIALTFYPPYDR